MTTPGTKRPRTTVVALAVVVVVAYSWWATSLPPFSTSGLVAVLIAGGVLIAVRRSTMRRRDHEADEGTGRVRWPWVAVIAGIGAWELQALFQHPREADPTISSILDPIEQWHVARLVLFFAWLWLGWQLAS